ncbi:Tyrosine recombinase XerC [Stieleria neptunia]|uniref:Tyrosine recombinase XerC n=1 Tax=Stieleria neptunia TaxID=2527979 RepID=A0A518HN22_9BACT|nr:Tyrosine recombinase XerC [Stieleria neptunia]
MALRVDELHHINVGNIARDGEHTVIRIKGKGNETRKGVLPPIAATPVNAWIASADIQNDRSGPLFRPGNSARGAGRDGFKRARLSVRSIQELIKKYCRQVGIDEAVSVHSLRVTAATEADKAGVPLIAIQKWLGHKDPRTTLRYIRGHEDLDRSPAYTIRYG